MAKCSNRQCDWYVGGQTPEGKKVHETETCPKCGTKIQPIDMLCGLLSDGKNDHTFDAVETVREVRDRFDYGYD